MKRATFLALMIITFIGVYSAQAKAQTPKRIQFARGRTSATINGTTGSGGVAYLIRASSGQKLVLNLTPASEVGIKVTTEGTDGEMVLLREEKGGAYEVGLETSGDYTIFIGSTNNKSVSFILTVKITKLADI